MTAVLRVAVPAPVSTLFDYLPPAETPVAPRPGMRVRVPFGRGRAIGVIVDTAAGSQLAPERLRRALALLDDEPALDADTLSLLRWAAAYYRHPPGEVFRAALPRLLREGRGSRAAIRLWRLTDAGRAVDRAGLTPRAPRQSALLELLAAHPVGLTQEELARDDGGDWRRALRELARKHWVEAVEAPVSAPARPDVGDRSPEPTAHQAQALAAVGGTGEGFEAFLLHGVTGSGKTEVYLQLAARLLRERRQTLVLVPEIGLTPQLVERFQRRLPTPLAVFHSGLSDGERLAAWRAAREGTAGVVVGTRSAVFAPLPRPGAVIVDEEHDVSYKQQDGFRYSARDLAVTRARCLSVPVILGSATPSLESLHNVARGRYRLLELPERPGGAAQPPLRLVDLRREPASGGLSVSLVQAMRRHLDAGAQVLLFLNRRGFAPTWFCPGCGWSAQCRRCDARMTFHRDGGGCLRCHHCGSQRPAEATCPECQSQAQPVGQGTERVEETVAALFPDADAVRIDRDSTRRRGAMAALLGAIRRGEHRVLIGTQMLTKGHHFPDVTLVGVLDADQALFGTDFRASERLAQLIVQVAGRAGRAGRPGEVLVQSAYPEHPLLQQLVCHGYDAFARAALAERSAAGWPPFSALALLRAEAADAELPLQFLAAARGDAEGEAAGDVELLGPAPAPMARRAGRYRAQLLLRSAERTSLQRFLRRWSDRLDRLPLARRVRWSLDVDPVELF